MSFAGAAKRAARCGLSWNAAGWILSVVIVAAAGYALLHLLSGIDFAKVGVALRATPVWAVLAAGALIGASYATYTLYDFFALRTIGKRHIPYGVSALAGFMAYTIGHNLGATVFTGGAIRFRVYSAWGLGIVDIAKVAFVTGLTFWLGNIVMLGIGISIAPDAASAINRLPEWVNRAAAFVALASVCGYLLWLVPRPRSIGRNGWQLTLPDARLTTLQIGIGVLDLSLAALAMLLLVSLHASVEIVPFLVTFVAASLLGFLSHTPGSLGVFEAAMIVALPQVERESLLASLLIFRGLYFVLPFCIAVLVFGARELMLVLSGRSGPEPG